MSGFKPTGYGPSAGFKFPASFGFTGSTGAYTTVQPHVRHKPRAFKDGGYVRESMPDPGSAFARRERPYAEWQREVGATSKLLPGYKKGGKACGMKSGGKWIQGAIKHPGALHKALGVPQGEKIPAKKLAKAAHSNNPTMRRRANLAKTLGKMHKADGGMLTRPAGAGPLSEAEMRMLRQMTPQPTDSASDIESMLRRAMPKKRPAPASTVKSKFAAAKGGAVPGLSSLTALSGMRRSQKHPHMLPATLGKKLAADGGRVYGSSSKGFGSDVRKTGEFIGQIPRMVTDALRGTMRSTQEDVATDKRRRIDSIADDTNTASNYSRGGKMKRMGYQMGGRLMPVGYAPRRRPIAQARSMMAIPRRPMAVAARSKGGAARYSNGGAAHSDEAQDRPMMKRIAEKVIGEHVRYPAPKGHKGLGSMMKRK